jgi:quinol monooxygenase YgiN
MTGPRRATKRGMVVGTLKIPLSPDRRTAVLEILRSVQDRVLAQPGCRAYEIYEQHEPDHSLVLVERWESEAALEAHIRSETYRRILSAIELSDRPPQVCFDYVSATKGMELIERSRRPSEPPPDSKEKRKEPPNTSTVDERPPRRRSL